MPSPVSDPIPIEARLPIPAAISPGTRMIFWRAPPSAVASISSTAAISGEEKMNAIAAKLPAAATTSKPCWGTSRLVMRTVSGASPAPSAMSGASGPRTSPNPIVPIAASRMPGRSTGKVGPPAARPWTGTCPPRPGSRAIANATITPATPRIASRYHSGGPWS